MADTNWGEVGGAALGAIAAALMGDDETSTTPQPAAEAPSLIGGIDNMTLIAGLVGVALVLLYVRK